MGRPRKNVDELKPILVPRRAPAKSLEARENQLVALAMDVAERQMRDGTVSSQVLTNFLKLGSTKERLEKEIMTEQKALLSAKTSALKSAKSVEDLYANALDAMRRYSGSSPEGDYER